MKKTTIIESIAFLYMVLFLYTGASKLMEYSVFKEQIAESPILAPVAPVIGILLPVTEIVLVLLFFIPRWRLKVFYASLTLMSLFTLYVIGILIFDDTLPCSCGGVMEALSWPQHIIFNSAFIVLALVAIRLIKQVNRAAKPPAPGYDLPAGSSAARHA